MTALDRADAVLKKGRELIDRLPIPRSDKVELRLHKDQRKVDRLRRLNEIYWPYGELDCVFDDRNTRALLDAAAPRRPRALRLRRRRDRLGPLPRRGPPAGAARDRRAARVRPEEDPQRRPPARARGPARAGDLRRRGRRARQHRRALLRLAAHARHAGARQARVDRRRRRPRARLDHGGPALAHRLQPQLLPPLQGPAGARAARARPRRRCRTSSSRASSTRRSAASASTSAAATA